MNAPGRVAPRAILAIVLTILTAAAFSRLPGSDFIEYDDNAYVIDNTEVTGGLSRAGLRWALTSLDASNWHPLTWLSHMADVELFGLQPWGHHLTNVVLHTISSVTLFLVLRGMSGAAGRSALAAALFAVHPLHVQSVAWVAERKDVLSGLFWVLTLGAYLRYVRAPARRRYLLVALCLALALGSKAMAMTLPAVLLLLDYWPLGRIPRGSWKRDLPRRCAEKAPLLLLAAVAGAVAVLAQRQGEAIKSLASLPFDARLWNASLSCLRYLGKTLVPQGLSIYYPHPGRGLSAAVGLASLFGCAALTALAFRVGRRRGYPLAGWLWYLVTLFPVIGLIQVGPQGMADRYTYLPLVGIFILLVWAGADLAAGRRGRTAIAAAAAAIVLTLAAMTWRETGFWNDSLTLADHSIAAVGRNGILLTIKGTHLSRAGRIEEAIPVLREAVELEPDGPYNHYNLASALARAGRAAEAVENYRISLRISPGDAWAHLALGALLAGMDRTGEALENLYAALRLAPDHHVTHRELSRVLHRLGRAEEALAHARRAVALAPDDTRSRLLLGTVLLDLSLREDAAAQFLEALRLDPHSREARANLLRARAAAPLDSEGYEDQYLRVSEEASSRSRSDRRGEVP